MTIPKDFSDSGKRWYHLTKAKQTQSEKKLNEERGCYGNKGNQLVTKTTQPHFIVFQLKVAL